jgi:hypothetical protein
LAAGAVLACAGLAALRSDQRASAAGVASAAVVPARPADAVPAAASALRGVGSVAPMPAVAAAAAAPSATPSAAPAVAAPASAAPAVAAPAVAAPASAAPAAPRSPAAVPAARRAPVERGRGFLSIYAEPWAYVIIDGHRIGPTPLMRQPVAAGAHRVRLERAGIQPREQRVTVRPGQTQLVDLDLQPGRGSR